MKIKTTALALAMATFTSLQLSAQQAKPEIKDIKVMESGPCENQRMTGTCWSFSGMSFFQAEMNRIGKIKNANLSEMFVVNNVYPLKAENYVRMHGKANFGEGGEFTDDLLVLRRFGIVPQEAYSGKQGLAYDHSKLVKKLEGIVSVAAKETGRLNPKWKDEVSSAVEETMGATPKEFSYGGKTYTPKSFAESAGLHADDYVLISSYTHHPYYSQHVLEVPDNWNWERVYNVPVEELSEITKTALEKGYTVAWGADVSGTFNPMSPVQQLTVLNGDELKVTATDRQNGFDNFENQDDHAMHIIGLAADEKGNTFFKVKNSWGKGATAGEYFYASKPYLEMMTTSIMVHKHALPKSIRKKLHI